jgi:inositol transporter-like SP family MFS transporter
MRQPQLKTPESSGRYGLLMKEERVSTTTATRAARPWYTATLGGMASYIDAATIVSTAMSTVLFASHFHLSEWGVGAISAALALSFATGAVVGGRLGDLLGRRKVYAFDLVVYALGVLTVIVAPTTAVLFAGIIITGLAMGADVPTSLALVAEEAPAGRQGGAVAYSQTLWLMGVAVTQFLGFFIGGLGSSGYRVLYLHLLVVAVVVWVTRRGVTESASWQRSRRDAALARRRSVKVLFRKPYGPALAATGLYFLVSGIMPNTVGQFGPYLITTVGHSSMQVFSLIGETTLILGLAIAYLLQRYVDRPKARRVFVAIGLVALVAGPIVPIAAGFTLASLVVLFFMNTISGTWAGEGMYKVWSQETFPTEVRSTAQGFTYGIARYMMAAVGFITPVLVNRAPAVLMGLLAALGIISVIIAYAWIPRLPRHGLIGQAVPDDAEITVSRAAVDRTATIAA